MARRTEFDLIRDFLAPLAWSPGAARLGDDAALLPSPGQGQFVATTDTAVEGVHFPPGGAPELIARRLLRVNLSDLAAMSATPFGYLLNLALPRGIDDAWLDGFARGLRADQIRYALSLFGGDTVSTPGPLTLTLTALGRTPPVRRSGAKPGDGVFVTGPIGDGHFGLRAATGRLEAPRLAERFWLPEPRFGALVGASAAADVSDGLVADLGHIARASGVGAELWLDAVPLSPEVDALGRDARLAAITGGDDYEIVYAAPDGPHVRIGRIVEGAGVRVLDAGGREIPVARSGWLHD